MIRPKDGVIKGMKPGGIIWFRLDTGASGFTGVGGAFSPITRRLVQCNRCRTSVRHGQVHGKARIRNRRIGGNCCEIESDQSPAQALADGKSREKISARTVTEYSGAIFIKSVVLRWWQ